MASYRDVRSAVAVTSDDSSSDSDNDEDQPWKRRKSSTSRSQVVRRERAQPAGLEREAPVVKQHASGPPSGDNPFVKKPKRNNVWGQVVMEQNEAFVAREMDEFGMDLLRDRDVESYNYKLGPEDGGSRSSLGAPSVSKPEATVRDRSLKRGFGETVEDSWLVNQQRNNGSDDGDDSPRKPVHERLGDRDVSVSHRKVAKARLGSRSESPNLSPNLSPMKFIDIDPTLSLKEITGMLAYSLQEAKRELMVRVVDVLGVDKSLELWKLTSDIEKDGGMMVLNGSRRRLPGGVFLQMMKTDPQITKKQINEIFAEEKKKENDQKHKRDKRRRKKTVQFKDIEEKDHEEEGIQIGKMDQEERPEGCQDIDTDREQSMTERMEEEEAGGEGPDAEVALEKDGGSNNDMEEGEIADDDQ